MNKVVIMMKIMPKNIPEVYFNFITSEIEDLKILEETKNVSQIMQQGSQLQDRCKYTSKSKIQSK